MSEFYGDSHFLVCQSALMMGELATQDRHFKFCSKIIDKCLKAVEKLEGHKTIHLYAQLCISRSQLKMIFNENDQDLDKEPLFYAATLPNYIFTQDAGIRWIQLRVRDDFKKSTPLEIQESLWETVNLAVKIAPYSMFPVLELMKIAHNHQHANLPFKRNVIRDPER